MPFNQQKRWTETEIRVLTTLVDNGFSLDAIATKLGRTISACKAKLSALREKDSIHMDAVEERNFWKRVKSLTGYDPDNFFE